VRPLARAARSACRSEGPFARAGQKRVRRWRWQQNPPHLPENSLSATPPKRRHALAVRAGGQLKETRVPKVWFQVREVEPPLEARLREIARDFEGATLHECAPRG